MAPRQTKSDARKAGYQIKSNVKKISQGKKPQGVKKPVLRSTRICQLQEDTVSQDGSNHRPTNDSPKNQVKLPQTSSAPLQAKQRKRKRQQEAEYSLRIPAKRPQNRLGISLASSAAENSVGDTPGQETASSLRGNEINPIHWWTQKGIWPKEYFEEGSNVDHLLARKKSTSSLRRKQSESSSVASSTTPSDQKLREEKSAPYRNPRYEIILGTKGSFMGKSELGIIDESRDLCQRLLETEQTIPKDSLFRDDVFDNLCEMIRNRNEPKVIQDISRLIVPSAQTLAIYGAKHLEVLIESVNEGWDNSISVTKPRPQPDYSVGFGRSAFTDVQLDKLKPFVGEIADS
ncbi:hypothetical protein ACJ73_08437, partial [Blastomyces percursus]